MAAWQISGHLQSFTFLTAGIKECRVPFFSVFAADINPLNAELNLICHFLALLGAHHILHVSRIRVK